MSVHPVLAALVFAAALNALAQAPAPRSGGPAAPVAKAPGPQAPAAAKTAPGAEKKPAEVPKIDGLTITRPNGAFLGLQVLNGNFVLTFYDKEKKKAKVDVARAVLRWPVKYQPADERTVLNPGGPNTLTSAKGVRPPLNFKVYVSLFTEGSDAAVESYVVDYRDDAPPAAGAAK
jgi:cytochrome c1